MPLPLDEQSQGLALEFLELLLCDFESAETQAEWLSAPLHWMLEHLSIQAAGLIELRNGSCQSVAHEGRLDGSWPEALFSEALDAVQARSAKPWSVWPLPLPAHENLLFWCRSTGLTAPSIDTQRSASPDNLTPYVSALLRVFPIWLTVRSLRHQIAHRDRMLEVAADWHNHQAVPELLEQIALAAASLLEADRASIFLWDKAARQLVGHPALGVEGKPLRLPDDAGVAGNVLRTLMPQRWDRSDPSDQVDRRVDAKIGYRTDSLLAVALLDRKGRAMGVFEVINQARGRFTEDHQKTLIELARHASSALFNSQRIQNLILVRDRLTQDAASQMPMIGGSEGIQKLRETIGRIANTDMAVILLGENGTGKEVVSRQIHYQSRRKHDPFVAVNCAALAESLLESELFGHEKGAFTDALETRIGKFEQAHGGTLFLDEIGDMSLGGQAKLLRVLEEKIIVRVGGSIPIPVDVRIVAATNQDLVAMVRNRKFREDLYFRLSVMQLQLPPLRERGSDILELAQFFLEQFCCKIGRIPPSFSEEARRRLVQHQWPGNIRELRNLMERIAYLCSDESIAVADLEFIGSVAQSVPESNSGSIELGRTLAESTDHFQQQVIEKHIRAANGNISLAAQTLGLQRSNLYRKMKLLGMRTPD